MRHRAAELLSARLPSSPLLATVLLAVVMCVSYSTAGAQAYPISQRGSVTQNVALTQISVTYGRPFARGRALFGQLIPWDSVWHPGADSASIIRFSRDVLVEGRNVPAGEYSVWLIPRERAPWTFILNRAARVFHQPYPGQQTDALRVDIATASGEHMETLAFYFPIVNRQESVMRIHWGETILPVRITAPPP